MKLFQFQYTKTEIIFFLVIILISIGIFGYYVNENAYDSYFDELYFILLADEITEKGIIGIDSFHRPYMYPGIIAFFSIIVGDNFSMDGWNVIGNIATTKIILSIFQYLVYLGTIFLIANSFAPRNKNRIIWYSIISFGFLNPYLIQSTTLFLTDILAACFSVIAIIILLNFDLSKTKYFSFAIILFFIGVMIRPATIMFLPVIISIIGYRFFKFRNFNIIKSGLVFTAIAIVIVFPQVYNNVTLYDQWSPLSLRDNYTYIQELGLQYGKIQTVVNDEERGWLAYENPISLENVSSLEDLIFNHTLLFIPTYLSHVYYAFDWGYVDSYIQDYYTSSRILGAWFLNTAWIFSLFGIIFLFQNKFPQRKKWLITIGLLFPSIINIIFYSITAADPRYYYAVFLLLIPFSGLAIHRFYEYNIKNCNYKKKIFNIIKFSIFYLLFNVVLLEISLLTDLSTGKINWFIFF